MNQSEGIRPASLLALYLLPSVGTAIFTLLAAPWLAARGLPFSVALPLGLLLVGMPIELGYLRAYARRRTGSGEIGGAIILNERKPIWVYAAWTALLFGFTVAASILLAPVTAYLAQHVFAWVPSAFSPDGVPGPAPSHTIAILCLAFITLVDGVLNPVVEELYFRGNLMPRTSLRGFVAVPVCAVLFSLQHYWQPHNYIFLIVVQLAVCTAVWRTRSVRVGIFAHATGNLFGAALSWAALLSS